MDERTEKYLTEEATKIGLIGVNNSWYTIAEILKKSGHEIEPQKIATFNGYINSSDIEIFEYTINGATKYCAELSYQTNIDDYNIETIIFNKIPSEQDINTARTIEAIKNKLFLKRLKPEFDCWECGIRHHWLDIEGSLDIKYKYWQDQYCGC